MKIKNELVRKLCFFDGNVRSGSIGLGEPIEAWKVFIEIDISQKNKTPFKIKMKLSNTIEKNAEVDSDVFEFDDTDAKRTMIFGNPFKKDNTLVDYIGFEYSDYIPGSLVYFWFYVFEVDAGTREDLYPFSTKQ